MHEFLDSEVPNIFLSSGYVVHETRHGRGVAITHVDNLTHEIVVALCLRSGRLRGSEFRYIRRRIALTQAALSKDFDRTEQTVANWEKRSQVPLEASLLIKQLALRHFGLSRLLPKVLQQIGDARFSDKKIVMRFDQSCDVWVSNFHAPATPAQKNITPNIEIDEPSSPNYMALEDYASLARYVIPNAMALGTANFIQVMPIIEKNFEDANSGGIH